MGTQASCLLYGTMGRMVMERGDYFVGDNGTMERLLCPAELTRTTHYALTY